jgi:CRISPR-associated protein Cas1
MPNLYVTQQGARIETEQGRILVTKHDEVLLSVPAINVDQIVLIGNVGITTPALDVLFDRQIGLLFLNRKGEFKGRLSGELPRNVELRQMQYRRADDPVFCLELSRRLVEGKIRNSRTLLQRRQRDRDIPCPEIIGLQELLDDLASVTTQNILLGMEGQAGRLYFAGLRRFIPPAWHFAQRNRRPPRDPVNALLSIAYTLLHEHCCSALLACSLDPAVGFLHKPRYGRDSLASDLMEEFRTVIADAVVMTLLGNRMVTPVDFTVLPGDRGVFVGRDVWKQMQVQFWKRLEREVRLPGIERGLSYRKLLEVQARKLRRAIEGEAEMYESFLQK